MADHSGLGDDYICSRLLSTWTEGGSLAHVIAFNELQHQLYNYIRHSWAKDDWTIEQFVHGLCDKASASGVEGYFDWAINSSVEAMTK